MKGLARQAEQLAGKANDVLQAIAMAVQLANDARGQDAQRAVAAIASHLGIGQDDRHDDSLSAG